MRIAFMFGVVLIVLGAFALAYQGFAYTRQEKIVDIGPIQATVDKHERISIPPIVGGGALAGGVILVLVGAKKGQV